MPGLAVRTGQGSRVTTGVRVVVVGPGRAVRSVAVIVLRGIPLVRVTAAFRGLPLPVVMVQGEHTTAEPGDHAEQQEPCEQTAHDAQKTPEQPSCKPNLAGIRFPCRRFPVVNRPACR